MQSLKDLLTLVCGPPALAGSGGEGTAVLPADPAVP